MLLASIDSHSWSAVRQQRERQQADDTTTTDTDGNYATAAAGAPDTPPETPANVPHAIQPFPLPAALMAPAPALVVEPPSPTQPTAPVVAPVVEAASPPLRSDALNATSVIQFAGSRRPCMSPLAVAQRSPYKDRFPPTTPPPHKIRRLGAALGTDTDSDDGGAVGTETGAAALRVPEHSAQQRRSPGAAAAVRAAKAASLAVATAAAAAAAEPTPAGPSGLARTALQPQLGRRAKTPLSQRRSPAAPATAAAPPMRNAAEPQQQTVAMAPPPTIRDGDIIRVRTFG